jgi:hypothetical protein
MIVGLLLGVLVASAVILLIMMFLRRSPVSDDGIADFKRHLNALSPEARRPIVEALKKEEDQESNDGT